MLETGKPGTAETIMFFDVVSSDQLIEVYRALDILDDKSEAIQKTYEF